MARALLLSPDDQAVSAITGVLEELSVTCERPLDGVSAAQKLNSNNFDLVLVDCENLPAAKLIFDVCRRGKDGHNPVPIAIVDGRAGLPTAFRLGAELILTKPVAKDQARATIRTAVGRLRKTSTNDASTTQWMATTSTATHLAPAAPGGIPASEPRAAAVAAPSASRHPASPVASAAIASELPLSAKLAPTASAAAQMGTSSPPQMSSAVDEVDVAPDTRTPEVKRPATFVSGSTVPRSLSDDPVLAELERQELGETPAANPESAAVEATKTDGDSAKKKEEASKKDSSSDKADHTPSFYVEKKKPRGALVVMLTVSVLAAGMYLAWMYQPGFRPLVEPQLNRVLALAGLPPIETPTPARPAQKPALPVPVTAPANGENSATDATATAADASSAPVSSPAAKTAPAPANSNNPTPAPPAPSSLAPTPAPTKVSAQTLLPPAASPVAAPPKSDASSSAPKPATKPADGKSATAAAAAGTTVTPSTTPLPEESSTLILSSKGAQNRLEYSIQPKYPADARAGSAEGTVVLKVIVGDGGKVQGVRLVEGNPALATAAVQAVRQWRYRPFVRDGKNSAFQTVVMIDFQKP
jgi:periplasmic protein TonB